MKVLTLGDFLVYPIVILGAIAVRTLLLTIGIDNSLIFMSCLFLVIHLCFTTLMFAQIRDMQDSFITRIESSAFVAVLSALTSLCTYGLISAIPILKAPFFFLKWLPYSNIWGDLSIVALPAFLTHTIGRSVITGVMQ